MGLHEVYELGARAGPQPRGGSYLPWVSAALQDPSVVSYFAGQGGLAGQWLKVANDEVSAIDQTFPGPLIGPYDLFREAVQKAEDQLVFNNASPSDALVQAQRMSTRPSRTTTPTSEGHPMCDTVVVVGDDGVLFGKNSDRDPNESQIVEWHGRRSTPPGSRIRCTWIEIPDVATTNAVLLSRPYWMWGAEMGTNEQGVTIGNEAVFTSEPYASTGLTGMDMLRLALERADTGEHAVSVLVDLLETHGQGGGCGHELGRSPTTTASSWLTHRRPGSWRRRARSGRPNVWPWACGDLQRSDHPRSNTAFDAMADTVNTEGTHLDR